MAISLPTQYLSAYDGSAVFFFINDDFAIYGEWDEEKGIVKESGTYKPDKDGLYRYEETK